MFFIKNSNKEYKDYKDKKYLWVILIIVIISAISLGIVQAFNKKTITEEDNLVKADSSKGVNYRAQTYISEVDLELENGDRYVGSKDAELKVFVYEDYDDVFSAKLATDINKLINEKSDEVAFIFRPFINPSNNSGRKALALNCLKSDRNWQVLRESFMKDLNEEKQLSLEGVIAISGINEDGLYSCINEAEKAGKIEELRKENIENEITGSPTILIDDELILGARPYEDYIDSNGDKVEGLKNLVNRLLSKSS